MQAGLHSVRPAAHAFRVMYTARLVCSDPACAEEIAAEAATLHELEALLCDCGCALTVVGWPDVDAEPLAQVIMLRVGRGACPKPPSASAARSPRRRAPARAARAPTRRSARRDTGCGLAAR